MLGTAGGQPEFAVDGRQGVDAVMEAKDHGKPFDVVLMDMQMPVMDGYDAIKELRSRGVDTPIIALTANAMISDRDECIKAGADGYVSKPIDLDELLDTIRTVLASDTPGVP